MQLFFRPHFLLKFVDFILPWLIVATLGFFVTGLYFALFSSPSDYQQGDAVRMMYVHVPAAWMSLGIYSFMAAFSCSYLIWRNYLHYIIANQAAMIGTAFALITLITGSLWGKPIWGTWWVWDARLSSMFILFLFYLGYIALSEAFDHPEQAAVSASVLSIIGLINVPIVKFSVNFWHSLHQPASILRFSGPAIHHTMLLPLFLMFLAFICYFLTILLVKIKTAIILRKTERLNLFGEQK